MDNASSAGGDSEPVIEETKEVTFSDASTDCSLGDSDLGTQSGYEVTVDVGSRQLTYLVTGDGEVLLCTESGLTPIDANGGDVPLTGATTTLGAGDGQDEPEPPTDAVSPRALAQALLDAIVADAAERAGVGPDEVVLVSSEQETFSDSSLGCPEPGRFYTQVLTPGHQVIVEAAGDTYDYRVTSLAGSFKLCE